MAKCNSCQEVLPPYDATDLLRANIPGNSTPSVTAAAVCAAERHNCYPNLPPSKRGCHEDRESQTLLHMSPTPRIAADTTSEESRPQASPHTNIVCAEIVPMESLRTASNCSCAKETFNQVRSPSLVSSPLRRCVPEIFTKLLVDRICVLRVTPSFDPIILRQLAAAEKEPFGVILQLYGTGTAPSNPRFLKALQFAINSGVTIVAVTQCTSGSCSLMTYANGVLLHKLGVIEGKDLTTEAALTKLAYLFGKGYKDEELRLKMESNLNGELCPTVYKITGQATLNPTQTSPSNMLEHNKHFRLSAQAGGCVCTHVEGDKNKHCADPQAPRNTDVPAGQLATPRNYSLSHESLALNPNH